MGRIFEADVIKDEVAKWTIEYAYSCADGDATELFAGRSLGAWYETVGENEPHALFRDMVEEVADSLGIELKTNSARVFMRAALATVVNAMTPAEAIIRSGYFDLVRIMQGGEDGGPADLAKLKSAVALFNDEEDMPAVSTTPAQE